MNLGPFASEGAPTRTNAERSYWPPRMPSLKVPGKESPGCCMVSVAGFPAAGQTSFQRFMLLLQVASAWSFVSHGAKTLTLESPCQIIAKGSYLGPAPGPVSPFLGRIPHDTPCFVPLRPVGRSCRHVDTCSVEEQRPNLAFLGSLHFR